MEKSSQTTITMIIAIVIVVLLAIIVFRYFLWILFAGAAFMLGYYFGYQNGKQRRRG